jgi:hypothetical protein
LTGVIFPLSSKFAFLRQAKAFRLPGRATTPRLRGFGGWMRGVMCASRAAAVRNGGVWTFGNWFSRNRGRISFFKSRTPSPILAPVGLAAG